MVYRTLASDLSYDEMANIPPHRCCAARPRGKIARVALLLLLLRSVGQSVSVGPVPCIVFD